MEQNSYEEHEAGVLCSKGIFKEVYDPNSNQLLRFPTALGKKLIKESLKDPKVMDAFKNELKNIIKDMSKEDAANFILLVKEQLSS